MHGRRPQGEAVGRQGAPCEIVMIDDVDEFYVTLGDYVTNQFQIFLNLRYFAMTGRKAMVDPGCILRVTKTEKRFTMAILRTF